MLFEDKLNDIIQTLEHNKLLLTPVEFSWGMLSRYDNFDQLSHLYPQSDCLDDTMFCFLKDGKMFKKYYPSIHPRLETLLYFHRRPLGVLAKNDLDIEMAYSIIFDPFIYKIIDLLGEPVICRFIKVGDNLIRHYKDIPAELFEHVGYISKQKRKNKLKGIKPIVIDVDQEGSLLFN